MSFKNFEKKSAQWVQAELCSSNRLDLRSKWIEEVLSEIRSKIKSSWIGNTIGIKKMEFYMVPLKNFPQKSGVRLFGKQPEWPSCLAFIPDFCSLKKHMLTWAYSALIFSKKKCFIESCDMSSSYTSRSCMHHYQIQWQLSFSLRIIKLNTEYFDDLHMVIYIK